MGGKYPPLPPPKSNLLTNIFFVVGIFVVGAFYAIETTVLIPILALFLPLTLLGKKGVSTYWRIANAFCEIVWGLLVRHVEIYGGWNHVYSGDVIPPNENAFVISNHKTWIDFLTIMSFGARKNRLGALKMFAKKSISFVPGIGWVKQDEILLGMSMNNFVFLSRDWSSDANKIMATFSSLRNSGAPFWIGSHLEGTRFSEKKLAESQEFAKKSGRKVLKNCLLPRVKGFNATVMGLRESLDAIYDVTLVYDHQRMRSPSFNSLIFSKWLVRPIDVHIHVRRFPIKDIPKDEKELEAWLFKVWEEKDELLEHFFTHDEFPATHKKQEGFHHKWFSSFY